ncbi:MAG: sodium-coupled permease, partial [Cyclobacteriaceae bacterium]|nr:sodium-coupled permease [Cyclobacteriaceae bacterium HetDA_MAG_MS6]
FSFDTSSKYNVWAGTLAGLFLMLSYFGSDQSQVQRYLTAKSLKDARGSLIMPAFLKIPMIFFMLLIGVGLYTFYIFHKAPVMFLPENGDASRTVIENKLSEEFQLRHQMRRESALAYLQDPSRKGDFQDSDRRLNEVRNSYASLGEDRNDTNYVTPYFILNELPNGVIGLIIAAIFAAALSSIDSGLNSLAASTTMDWVKKMEKEERPAKFYLRVSRTSTVLWGLFATFTALAFGETESIVELVNNVGSYFYGSIFGIFVLLFVKRINGKAAFAAILCGILSVFILDALYITEQGDFLLASPYLFQLLGWFACPDGGKWISFLWLNPIGTLTVVFFGWLFSKMMK